MKANRSDKPHAPCPVRYAARGLTMCGATDTPCVYCADREPNAPAPSSRARRRKPRDTRNRPTPPFEDS